MQAKHVLFVVLVVLSQLVQARGKEPYCTWDHSITEARLEVADSALLSERRPSQRDAIEAAIAEHLPFGMPEYEVGIHEHLLAQPDFLIWYDNDLRAPLWTAYHSTSDEAQEGRERADSFRSDPRLRATWSRSECADYKEKIFDQGHMVPRADMNRSEVAMDQTFLMTNMTPQHCAFNRGVWQVLEALGRRWASQVAETWVISGTIFDRDGISGRDPDQIAWRMMGRYGARVGIPSHQYKVFVRREGTGWITLSFILPNTDALVPDDQVTNYLDDHIATLADITNRSGFSFLSGEATTEGAALWPFEGSMPGQLTSLCKDGYPPY